MDIYQGGGRIHCVWWSQTDPYQVDCSWGFELWQVCIRWHGDRLFLSTIFSINLIYPQFFQVHFTLRRLELWSTSLGDLLKRGNALSRNDKHKSQRADRLRLPNACPWWHPRWSLSTDAQVDLKMNVRWKANNDVRLPGVGNTILMTGLTLLKFTQQLISSIPGKSWCGLSDVVCIQGSLRF